MRISEAFAKSMFANLSKNRIIKRDGKKKWLRKGLRSHYLAIVTRSLCHAGSRNHFVSTISSQVCQEEFPDVDSYFSFFQVSLYHLHMEVCHRQACIFLAIVDKYTFWL